MSEAPLDGVTVLDLSIYIPGPYATLLLREMGARVIKVEPPGGAGDPVRGMPPSLDDGTGALFATLNRGKESVVLDLKSDGGREAFLRLAEEADVVVSGFRPGVLDRLGIAFDTLAERNPALVRCALTGFGLDGPRADRAGHDLNYLGWAGALALSGPPQGATDPPALPGVQTADLAGGLFAAFGIVCGLLRRERTGRGSVVDAPLTDAAASFAGVPGSSVLAGETPRRGRALLHGGAPCYNLYRTADDEWLAVGALEPKFWMALCGALELPDLIPLQFARGEEGEQAIETLRETFARRTRAEWLELLDPVDCCVSPVLDLDEALDDVHARHRAVLRMAGGQPRLRGGATLADREDPDLAPAPALGEDAPAVLREIGYDDASIRELEEDGALG